MKKNIFIIVAVLSVILTVGCVYADDVLKIGELTKLNVNQEGFSKKIENEAQTEKYQMFRIKPVFGVRSVTFYDSLGSMLMGLVKGEVDEVYLPRDVAKYVMRNSDSYELAAIVAQMDEHICLCLGFRDDEAGQKLKALFDKAITAIDDNGRLAILKSVYITEPKLEKPLPSVKIEKFEGAPTIKVAVTGDLPPIDFIAEDGVPAGFNTAVLAELAKNAKVNIETLNIESGARAAALVSGRADVVFWFEAKADSKLEKFDVEDIPEGIILSKPYYSWDEGYALEKK